MSLYGQSKQEIAREYGNPVRLDRTGSTWYRYSKGHTILMVRYGKSDTADRIVVSDIQADPGAEGDTQRYPPFKPGTSLTAPSAMRADNL